MEPSKKRIKEEKESFLEFPPAKSGSYCSCWRLSPKDRPDVCACQIPPNLFRKMDCIQVLECMKWKYFSKCPRHTRNCANIISQLEKSPRDWVAAEEIQPLILSSCRMYTRLLERDYFWDGDTLRVSASNMPDIFIHAVYSQILREEWCSKTHSIVPGMLFSTALFAVESDGSPVQAWGKTAPAVFTAIENYGGACDCPDDMVEN